ncbi:MAG: PhoH family protein [Eubacterium sp.]|nr:PhoH family protein [Eubacterium sp.]
MRKNFVLDTNILLENPNAIYGFEDNHIYICGTTLQELDSKKRLGGELGYNARETARILEEFRVQGDLRSGVEIGNGGKIFVEPDGVDQHHLPNGYSIDQADNRIISSCIYLNSRLDSPVILVTNDVSMRVNASVCGVRVEYYLNDHAIDDTDAYKGYETVETDSALIDRLYADNAIAADDAAVTAALEGTRCYENEYYILKCGHQSAVCIHQDNELKLLPDQHPYGVHPRNAVQKMAIHALCDPTIDLVILKGPAGTAKTFLPLATGLEYTYDSKKSRRYSKIMIAKPNVESDKEFGFLPGDMDDKTEFLLQNFYDNIETILRKGNKDVPNDEIQQQIEDMMYTKVLNVFPLAYMRGRSISDAFIIVDEVQNTTRTQITDILTRPAEGGKLILAGDVAQIDNHTLDEFNNGLTFSMSLMENSRHCAQLTFDEEQVVRSGLSAEVTRRLKQIKMKGKRE